MSTEEASTTSPTRPTLASIYHAKKSGKLEENTVEVLKQQFQTDIQKNVQQFGENKLLNRQVGLILLGQRHWLNC
jgi:hypothetical protein